MSFSRRHVPVAPEFALAITGSGGTADLANAVDTVSSDLPFNAPFALEPFSLGGDFLYGLGISNNYNLIWVGGLGLSKKLV